MKGYVIPCGYMGWINGTYKLFATEDEYVDAYRSQNN